MKQKCAYIVINKENLELDFTLSYRKYCFGTNKTCLSEFLRSYGRSWKYWYRRGYRVKKLWLNDEPCEECIYSINNQPY